MPIITKKRFHSAIIQCTAVTNSYTLFHFVPVKFRGESGQLRCNAITRLTRFTLCVTSNWISFKPQQNGWHFADDIFRLISLSEYHWSKFLWFIQFISYDLIHNKSSLVQETAWRLSTADDPVHRHIYASQGPNVSKLCLHFMYPSGLGHGYVVTST